MVLPLKDQEFDSIYSSQNLHSEGQHSNVLTVAKTLYQLS